jgi:hypothetical protein
MGFMKLYNTPQRLSFESYDEAIATYIERVVHIPGVRAVFTLGSVNAPGLSDIDIVTVVSDEFESRFSENLDVQNINSALFIHGPIIISESQLKDIQWIIFATNLQVVHGNLKAPDFSELPAAEAFYLARAYLVDFCESRMAQFATARYENILDARAWHARIWSVTHSAYIAREYLEYTLTDSEEALLDLVRRPREVWLRGEDVSKADFLIAFNSAEILNKAFFKVGLDSLKYKACSSQPKQLKIGSKKFNFIKEYSEINSSAYVHTIAKRGVVVWRVDVPKEYFDHLHNYVQATIKPGLLEARPSATLDERSRVLQKRALLVKQHVDWLQAHAGKSNSLRGYLGFNIDCATGAKATLRRLLHSYFLRRV